MKVSRDFLFFFSYYFYLGGVAEVINCQSAFPRQDNRLDWLRHAVPVSPHSRSKSIRQDSITYNKANEGEEKEDRVARLKKWFAMNGHCQHTSFNR